MSRYLENKVFTVGLRLDNLSHALVLPISVKLNRNGILDTKVTGFANCLAENLMVVSSFIFFGNSRYYLSESNY